MTSHSSPWSFPGLSRILIAVFFLSSVTCAAADSGSVSGTVADPSGAVVPGAAVVLRNPATAEQFSATAGADGSYSFAAVPPGHYGMQVSVSGFKP